jgi:hypothetical protein
MFVEHAFFVLHVFLVFWSGLFTAAAVPPPLCIAVTLPLVVIAFVQPLLFSIAITYLLS